MSLAINVGGMLISFIALVAMANFGMARMSGLFRDTSGLLRFNLAMAAAVAALAYVERRGAPTREGLVWAGVDRARGRDDGPSGGRIPWDRRHGLPGRHRRVDPLFLQAGNKRTYGAGLWIGLLSAAVAANLAFAVWGPLGGTGPVAAARAGLVHWPIAFVMGITAQDCLAIGKLLGEKLILTEFGAYLDLSNQFAAAGAARSRPSIHGRW